MKRSRSFPREKHELMALVKYYEDQLRKKPMASSAESCRILLQRAKDKLAAVRAA